MPDPAVRAPWGEDPGRIVTGVLAAGLATWSWTIVWSNHPSRLFERFRGLDPWGVLIPNWRFFAPMPSTQDVHLLHRVQRADGSHSDWEETSTLQERRWWHTVVYVRRRQGKALFDIVTVLLHVVGRLGVEAIETTPSYRLLENLVAHTVRARAGAGAPPRGFQFAIVRHAGYDEDEEPDYLIVSRLVPLVPGAVPAGPPVRAAR